MADITDPDIVRFADEHIRPAADRYVQLYWLAKSFLAKWDAANLGGRIPGNYDPIVDGAAADGRGVISGEMARGLQTTLATLVGDLEANSAATLKTLTQMAVNPLPDVTRR